MIQFAISSLFLLLAFTGPLPAQTAPASGFPDEMMLARLVLRADIVDGVARVRVAQTFRNRRHSRMPGDEAITSFDVSPLTAFWKYRITEEGKWWDGQLVPRQEGRAEYDRIVSRSRDPGLLEWQDACRYTSSVYPVPPDEGTKEVELEYDEALRMTTDGKLLFRFPLNAWRVEEAQFELRVRDARGLSGYGVTPAIPVEREPAGGDTCAFVGRLEPLGRLGDLELRLHLARPFAGPDGRAARPLELPSGELLVPIPIGQEDLASRAVTGGFLIGKRRGPAPSGVVHLGEFTPVPTGPERQPPFGIEADFSAKLAQPASLGPVWERLRQQAEAQTIYRERLSNRAAAPSSARTTAFGCASPFGSFLAKPAPDPARKLPGPRSAREAAQLGSLPALPEEGGLAARRPASADWHFSPLASFRAAREQAHDRACFANQKVLAGALEMYELDGNVKVGGVGGLADRATFGPLFSPAPDAPCDLVAVHPTRSPWRPGRWVDDLPVGLWKELVDGGYLHARLECPGAGAESWANYVLLQPEGKVVCLRHGTYSSTGSARQQLVDFGVSDPATLARAEQLDFLVERQRRALRQAMGELVELLVFVLILGLVVLGFQTLGVGWRVLCGTAVALIASGVMFLQLPRERGAEEWGQLLAALGLLLVFGIVGRLLLRGLAALTRRGSAWLTPAIRSKPEARGPER